MGALGKHVDNEAAEIEQHPVAARFALAVQQAGAHAFQLFFDFVADGFELRGAEPGADQEKIRERAEPFEIQEHNVGRLLFLRGADGRANLSRNRVFPCCHR